MCMKCTVDTVKCVRVSAYGFGNYKISAALNFEDDFT